MPIIPPLGCDTMVALSSMTDCATTLFAKNSDRYPWECQRFVLLPASIHPEGAQVRCQYIEIPQVRETARVLGSQPEWLWGLEHGVNEYGVAIGNEMVATREPAAPTGLLGMDLVRLGLERGRNASKAVEVITALIETHGQGGSGEPNVDWAYHNSFLVCDPERAWILETSGRHWATRSVVGCANISNHLSIGTDWARLDGDAASFAVDQGWALRGVERLDFADAYRDTETLPPSISENRYRRAGSLLRAACGGITNTTMREILRDHFEHGRLYPGRRSPDDANYFSICMHAESLQSTTASMVAELRQGGEPPVAWMALGSPCCSIYLPYYVHASLPAAVTAGSRERSPGVPWWAFRDLQTRVESDPEGLAPRVAAYWAALEAEVAEHAAQVEARAMDIRARGDRAGAVRLLTDFMGGNVRAMIAGLQALGAEAA